MRNDGDQRSGSASALGAESRQFDPGIPDCMKQKRTKLKPTAPKEKRWPSTSDEWHKYIEYCASAEYEDYVHDCEVREYKKSEKYKQVQQLADKFKK